VVACLWNRREGGREGGSSIREGRREGRREGGGKPYLVVEVGSTVWEIAVSDEDVQALVG
jgi:hypothetical protein